MHKDFDKWNEIKKSSHNNGDIIKFQHRHIIFMKIGANIGYEQDGKGKDFLRPVLVYKKFNNRVFYGIPLTSKIKNDKFHFEFEYKKGKRSFAILSQLRLFDIKRAKYYDGKISKNQFKKLEEKFLKLIYTPLHIEGECTKAICNNIIPQKALNVKANILVTGSNGQVGSEIKALIQNYNYHFTTSDTLDITKPDNVRKYCELNNIKVIINCAAYTAVDKAEEDMENADKVNHLAVKYLAQIAKEKEIKLIHISTDYVFDGKNYRPYIENDKTNPTGIYGKTKLDGELAMIEINPKNSIIIRTSWVYSSFGANFVKTMLKLGKERDSLGVIFDQIGTPTYARDLAEVLLKILSDECLILNDKVEIYNFSNEGVVSWYDFAKEIMSMAKLDCKIIPIETRDYPTPAKRPHYSVLNKTKIKKAFGIEIPYWKKSLSKCLKIIMENKNV